MGIRRVGDGAIRGFAASPGNLTGVALAAVGVALHLVGVAGGVWWPLLVAALYACGLAIGRSRSRPQRIIVVDPGPGPDVGAIRAALDQVEARSIDLPDELALQVRLIVKGLRDLLARIDLRQAGSADAFVVSRMATEYLPATIGDYLSIPRAQARVLRGANGRTAFEMAQGQLALLNTQVGEVSDALVRGDHDRLATQGHFLESRFAASPLALPPADHGAAPRPEG